MLFILIIIVFIMILSLREYNKEELEKEIKDWERITGNKYYG